MPALADVCGLLHATLRCPGCRSRLAIAPDVLGCEACGFVWSRPRQGYVDLRPPNWDVAVNQWQRRQSETCEYYDQLRKTPSEASDAFRADLGPFAATFESYRGRVLAVGGGNGIARAFLPSTCRYVSLDPYAGWLSDEWDVLGGQFGCLAEPLAFVQGFAERLPFSDSAFDAVICLWTLNHCAEPERVVAEIGRVLRPGGRLLLILEDGEPTWSEIVSGVGEHYLIPTRAGLMRAKVAKRLNGWPAQIDHVTMDNHQIRLWTADGFHVLRRWWVGCYLALEYEGRPKRSISGASRDLDTTST